MKNSTPEIREHAKHFVLLLGVREAARQLGLNEDTVSAWSARYHWLKNQRAAKLKAIPHPAQANASNADPISTNSKKSKINLALATARASERFAQLKASTLVQNKTSASVKNWTQVGEVVFGWKQDQQSSGVVSPLTVYSKQTVIGYSLGKDAPRDRTRES